MIRTAVGAGPRRHANGEQVAAADFSTKDSALGDAGIVRQRERGRDEGAVAGALAKLGLRVDSERDQRAKDELNNAGLTDQFSTRDPQIGLDLRGGSRWGYATPRADRRAHRRAHRRSDKKEGSFWSRSCGSRDARRPRRWPDGSDTRSYNGSQRCQKDVSKKMSNERTWSSMLAPCLQCGGMSRWKAHHNPSGGILVIPKLRYPLPQLISDRSGNAAKRAPAALAPTVPGKTKGRVGA